MLLQRSRTREKIWVITVGLTGLARRSSITRAGLTEFAQTAAWINEQIGLAKIATQIAKQIRLAGLAGLAWLPGLAQTVARIYGQIRLAGLTGLAARSRKKVVPIMLLTWKVGLRRIQLTWKAGLWRIRLTQKTGLHKTWGIRN
jgi:hypothetical protein